MNGVLLSEACKEQAVFCHSFENYSRTLWASNDEEHHTQDSTGDDWDPPRPKANSKSSGSGENSGSSGPLEKIRNP